MRIHSTFLCLALMLSGHLFAADPTPVWQDVIDGKHLVIMRHALAPGTGDPASFEVENCSTQRNLSDTGKQQARKIGDKFRQAGIQLAEVYSSQWCRCLDTATEMDIGATQEQPYLNSFFGRREVKAAQMSQLRSWIKTLDSTAPKILVTHQVVITALTGVYPASGEAVIFTMGDDGEVTVVDTLPPE